MWQMKIQGPLIDEKIISFWWLRMIEELEVIDRWWIAMDMYNLSMEKKWSFLDISGSEASDIFRLVLLYRLEGISNVKCKVVMCYQRGEFDSFLYWKGRGTSLKAINDKNKLWPGMIEEPTIDQEITDWSRTLNGRDIKQCFSGTKTTQQCVNNVCILVNIGESRVINKPLW